MRIDRYSKYESPRFTSRLFLGSFLQFHVLLVDILVVCIFQVCVCFASPVKSSPVQSSPVQSSPLLSLPILTMTSSCSECRFPPAEPICNIAVGRGFQRDLGCLPFARINRLGRTLNNGKGFSKISKPTERNGAYHLLFDFP